MVRFSEKETCKIVELLRQCDCLWNVNNADYKNKHVRHATCEAIARKMNIENFTARDVRAKIKSLRSTYRGELIKLKRLSKDGNENHSSSLKWFSIMDSIYKELENSGSPVDNQSVTNGEHTSEGILHDDSQWEQQCGNSSEVAASVTVSSAPSLPSESEVEQSIRSISDPDVISGAPEIQSVQTLSNSDLYSEVQSVHPVSQSQVVTVTPEILTVKAVSKSEDSSVPSGIQTVKTASTPKFYALVPEIQTSKSVSNSRYVTLSTGNNQNVRYVSSSPGITLAPEIQQGVKQASADETLLNRKRRHEEVSSTVSTTGLCQANNTRTVIGDFSDRGEDEMDAFGHFVALNLRKLSMQSALSAQAEILSILTRHRLNDPATNLPSKQTFPCIVTNGSTPTQNPVVLQKLFHKS